MGSNIAPSPSPHPTFFHFLNIVQYFFVHCTIPSILGSHPPYPTSPHPQHCVHIHPDPRPTNPTPHLTPSATDPPPHRIPPPQFFFLNFHKNFNSSFTSTLTPPNPTPPTDPPTSPPPTPPKKNNFFFEFSQKLQFFVHIHPDPSPDPPPPPTPP